MFPNIIMLSSSVSSLSLSFSLVSLSVETLKPSLSPVCLFVSLSSFSLSSIETLKLDRFTTHDRFGAIELRRRSLDIIELEWF
ncbi:hypothetical protein ACOSQ3_010154 [Xanthoceras sorbifolium]